MGFRKYTCRKFLFYIRKKKTFCGIFLDSEGKCPEHGMDIK